MKNIIPFGNVFNPNHLKYKDQLPEKLHQILETEFKESVKNDIKSLNHKHYQNYTELS